LQCLKILQEDWCGIFFLHREMLVTLDMSYARIVTFVFIVEALGCTMPCLRMPVHVPGTTAPYEHEDS
jgi:hypothetical protein